MFIVVDLDTGKNYDARDYDMFFFEGNLKIYEIGKHNESLLDLDISEYRIEIY